MNTNYKKHIEHTFDAYCKRVLRNEAFDYYAELERKRQRELSLEDCFEYLYTEDTYFKRQDVFTVAGLDIVITEPDISAALKSLSKEKRDVVLLTCCLDLADRVVAEMVDLARRTVSYKRAVALKELRGLLQDVRL